MIQVITWYAPELQDKISSEDLWEEMGIVHQRQLKKILHCLEKKQGKEIGIQTDTIQEEEEWEMNKEREMKMEWNEKKKLKKLKEKENIMRVEKRQELDKLKNDEEKMMIMKMRKNKKEECLKGEELLRKDESMQFMEHFESNHLQTLFIRPLCLFDKLKALHVPNAA